MARPQSDARLRFRSSLYILAFFLSPTFSGRAETCAPCLSLLVTPARLATRPPFFTLSLSEQKESSKLYDDGAGCRTIVSSYIWLSTRCIGWRAAFCSLSQHSVQCLLERLLIIRGAPTLLLSPSSCLCLRELRLTTCGPVTPTEPVFFSRVLRRAYSFRSRRCGSRVLSG